MKIRLSKHLVTILILTIIIIILGSVAILGLIHVYERNQNTYKDGIYYNHAYGYHSEIKVKVIVKDGKLYEIEILDHQEPQVLADVVFKRLPSKMIKKNTPDVDIVSGATYTSNSLIEAVSKALDQAKPSENR
ncbi:MAG: FMN-binding protein [Peptostreptococcales bacterium]|jgi:uncharacterized protein with FMN-binding domain